jgi:Multicopper oxidase
MLQRYGHIVIQIDADNPGVWPFHCHIAWHMSMGLAINVMENPADITQLQIPMVMQQTCKDWDAYSSKNVVDQIDAGI